MPQGWKGFLLREFVWAFAWRAIQYMPCVAGLVIGSVLTWFNVVELHKSPVFSFLLCLAIPFILAFFLCFFGVGIFGTEAEAGIGCGVVPLVLFLLLWHTFLVDFHKARNARLAAARATLVQPHGGHRLGQGPNR